MSCIFICKIWSASRDPTAWEGLSDLGTPTSPWDRRSVCLLVGPSRLQTSLSGAALRVAVLQLMLRQLLQVGAAHTLCHSLLPSILKIMHKLGQKIAHLERPTAHAGQ